MESDGGALTARLAAAIEELEQQREALLQSHQLKNDLIAVLAHDIKGPLTSIAGFAELLQDGYLEGDAAIDAAKTIFANGNRLATLANDILTLSRVERGELEIADQRVDLLDLLKKVVEAKRADRTIALHVEVDHAHVRGDAEWLTQAFEQLISNAVRFSPGGEPVTVQMMKSEDDTYIIGIHDRGIGIPQDEIAHVYRRFWRASNARRAKLSGTGLGLFAAKMIVERHMGLLDVNSVLDRGSTFEVTLPSYERANAGKSRRVTILTKDVALSRFVAFELRSHGYRVREESRIEDAVGGDVRNGDVFLVDKSGATPTELRTRLRGIASVELIGLGAAKPNGWDRILGRPFLVSELLASVQATKEPASVQA